MLLSRNRFLAGVAAAALAPGLTRAQSPKKPFRLGTLEWEVPGPELQTVVEAFMAPFKAAGIGERDIVFEPRYSGGEDRHFPRLAAELIDAKVDAIVAWNTAAALAAMNLTKTIPIIAGASNPERMGLAASLARPGGNVTGTSDVTVEVHPLIVQTIKDAFPGRMRVGYIMDASNLCSNITFEEGISPAARSLGLTVVPINVDGPSSLDAAFAMIGRERIEVLLPHVTMWPFRRQLLDFAHAQRIPVFSSVRYFVEAGALVSYGADWAELARNNAKCVVRIMQGAKPADIPFFQPTYFELAVNLKMARELAIEIGPMALARATHVVS